MMNTSSNRFSRIYAALNKPEYTFRPTQIWKRLKRRFMKTPETARVVLPWGLELGFRPNELIGASIWRMGLYDLCVTEALWRLAEPGEHAIDVGANIGHMTSVLAARVGSRGTVQSFEPHPSIFKMLYANSEHWRSDENVGSVTVHQIALSEKTGIAMLSMSTEFNSNNGSASIEGIHGSECDERSVMLEQIPVPTRRLDEFVARDVHIGVLKIDVEGHELSVFRGATELFESGRCRDIIFEEHRPYPSPVTNFLTDCGYTIFMIHKAFFGPEMQAIEGGNRSSRVSFDAPNFLATLDPGRAKQKFTRRGWLSLQEQPLRAVKLTR